MTTEKNCKFTLSNLTYADFIFLSSTIACIITQSLDEDDVNLFVDFIAQITANISIITTKKDNLSKNQDNNQEQQNLNTDIIANQEVEQQNTNQQNTNQQNIGSSSSRAKTSEYKLKKIKKVKKRIKKTTQKC